MMNSTSIKPIRRSGTSIVAMKRLNNTSSFSLAQAPFSAVSAHSSAAKTKGGNQPSPTPTYIEFPTSPQPPAQGARSLALAVGMHAKIVIFSFITSVPYLHPLLRLILSMASTNSSSMLNLNKVHTFPTQSDTFFWQDICFYKLKCIHMLFGIYSVVCFSISPEFSHVLFLNKSVKAGIAWPRCDVCCKSTKGFTFRCRVNSCNFQMHPCCAMLSTEIKFPNHPHPLKVLPPGNTLPGGVGGGNDQPGMVCGECKKKRSSGRVYSCTVCDYHLHALCAKSMINGLQEYGIKPPEKPNMLGTAARLASQVVIEFIGGLIEGFGEGVGEVLVQNIGRGRRSSNRRRIA